MQINNIGNNQSYGLNTETKNNNKSFMGHLTDAINTTAKTTENFADFVVVAKNAIDSPEEVTVRVLNDKLEDVVNNKKLPTWLQKTATYTCAAMFSGLTFLATKKVIQAPGRFAEFAKKQLAKTETGNSLMNLASTLKDSTVKLVKSLKIQSKLIDNVKGKIVGLATTAKDKFVDKFPKTVSTLSTVAKKLKLDNWTKKDYIKNIFSGLVALSYGKKYVDKHTKNNTEKPKALETTKETPDLSYEDAA